MKKLVIVIFLAFVALIIYESCKSEKQVQKTKQISDSTALHRVHSVDVTAMVDSSRKKLETELFLKSLSKSLEIGSIKKTTEETPAVNSSLTFNADSLKLKGDTLKTTTEDGTKLLVFVDKKTGSMVAEIKRIGHRKETFEVENLKIKSDQNTELNKQLLTEDANLKLEISCLRDSLNDISKHEKIVIQNKHVTIYVIPLWIKIIIAGIAAIAVFTGVLKRNSIFSWVKKLLKIGA